MQTLTSFLLALCPIQIASLTLEHALFAIGQRPKLYLEKVHLNPLLQKKKISSFGQFLVPPFRSPHPNGFC